VQHAAGLVAGAIRPSSSDRRPGRLTPPRPQARQSLPHPRQIMPRRHSPHKPHDPRMFPLSTREPLRDGNLPRDGRRRAAELQREGREEREETEGKRTRGQRRARGRGESKHTEVTEDHRGRREGTGGIGPGPVRARATGAIASSGSRAGAPPSLPSLIPALLRDLRVPASSSPPLRPSFSLHINPQPSSTPSPLFPLCPLCASEPLWWDSSSFEFSAIFASRSPSLLRFPCARCAHEVRCAQPHLPPRSRLPPHDCRGPRSPPPGPPRSPRPRAGRSARSPGGRCGRGPSGSSPRAWTSARPAASTTRCS